MSLQVHNTLTRKKETFEPLDKNLVKIYLCGPTVYDLLHVGNFRGPIVYNLIRNWLEQIGYKVKIVYNYTDVDDKIINRAIKEKVDSKAIAQKYTEEFQKDFNHLGLRPHDLNPTVTESMDAIVKMISELIECGKAYAIPGGDVNYSVRSFEEYGKLSNRKPDELIASGRIERDPAKRDPLDFALWKKSKEGEPSWESPWGKGRPGWHIECSAMAKKYLGEQIDIHGGGMDLVFPHHENEIAQTEGCTHKQFAKYWIHNNMIEFGGAKMSKSLGNIVTARGFMSQYNAEILKYMMLSVHYRSISDFSEDGIQHAIRGLARIYSALSVAEKYKDGPFTDPSFKKVTDLAWEGITTALNDDFNTPEAFARVFEVVRQFNSQVKLGNKKSEALAGKANAFIGLVKKFGTLTALFQQEPSAFLKTLDDLLLKKMNISREAIDSKVQLRTEARANKDFKKSDELRAELAAMGISVMDTPEGTLWEVTK